MAKRVRKANGSSEGSRDVMGGTMWQCWVTFYIGLWILASSFVFGQAQLNNLIFGCAVAILSFWAGMAARARTKKGAPTQV